jgi:hypothetical protein
MSPLSRCCHLSVAGVRGQVRAEQFDLALIRFWSLTQLTRFVSFRLIISFCPKFPHVHLFPPIAYCEVPSNTKAKVHVNSPSSTFHFSSIYLCGRV